MSTRRTACLAILLAGLADTAQAQAARDTVRVAPLEYEGGMQPVMDNTVFTHLLLEQAEDRWNGRNHNSATTVKPGWERITTSSGSSRRAWSPTAAASPMASTRCSTTAQSRPTSTCRPACEWISIKGRPALGRRSAFKACPSTSSTSKPLATSATVAGSPPGSKGSYDLLITNSLILQPEAELNFYGKADPARGSGSGLSDIDAGLRLRYEFSRKLAPYVGISYGGRFFQSARYARQEGESANDVRFTFGLRTWF